MRRFLLAATVAASLVALSGCATTQVGQFGWLPNRQPLVTLIVTEDRDIVYQECADLVDRKTVAGCQRSYVTVLPDEQPVRMVRIVRYTDVLPSAFAFEIDGHELCHAVADVQGIEDPCHDDPDTAIHASVPWTRVRQFLPAR